MKTLKDLTPEIRAKIDGYKRRCTEDLYSGKEYDSFDKSKTTEYVERIYEIANQKYKPVVIIANDPNEYKDFFKSLKNNIGDIVKEFAKKNNLNPADIDIDESSYANISSTSHYMTECSVFSRSYFTWYKFIMDEFELECSKRDTLNWLYENSLNNIARCYFAELFCLVLRVPSRIIRNEIGFHSTTEPAIQWKDDYSMYYVNGRRMEADIFKSVLNKTMTFAEFMKIDNEDIKAGIITMIKENEGNEGLLKFLGAVEVDSQTIVHDSGHMEEVKLFKTKEKFSFLQDRHGESNQPYAWTQMQCPSTGQYYLIDTSADFDNVLDSMKFHRPEPVNFDLAYNFKTFNN